MRFNIPDQGGEWGGWSFGEAQVGSAGDRSSVQSAADEVLARHRGRSFVATHPQAAERIRVYLEAASHAHDREGPLFRPVRRSWRVGNPRRHLDPDLIDRIVRKYVGEIGLHRAFSAHSMRAMFITRALDNGHQPRRGATRRWYAAATTTKLYDRRGYNPEKSASFFASY